jgi:hypothetical protein
MFAISVLKFTEFESALLLVDQLFPKQPVMNDLLIHPAPFWKCIKFSSESVDQLQACIRHSVYECIQDTCNLLCVCLFVCVCVCVCVCVLSVFLRVRVRLCVVLGPHIWKRLSACCSVRANFCVYTCGRACVSL